VERAHGELALITWRPRTALVGIGRPLQDAA
jgi:hypothetical protein